MKIYIFPITILMLLQFSLFGQETIHHEEVRVIKSYNPMVDDANKININPVIRDTTTQTKEEVKYRIYPIKLDTDIDVPAIKAAKMSGMPKDQLQRFFMKTGFGNYVTPYFELYYNTLRSRQNSFGIHYKHLSSHGKIKDYAFQGFSENRVDGNASFFTGNHIIDMKGGYSRDVVHYYGRPDSLLNDTLDRNAIRQRFHTAHFSTLLKSNYWGDNRLNHSIGLSYNMLSDLYPTTEHGVALAGNINKHVEWFNFSPYQEFGLNLSGDFFNTTPNGEDTTLTPFNTYLARVNPYFSTKVKELYFKAGFMLGFENENNGKLYFFPDILLKIYLKEQKFLITGGLDGNIEHCSFKNLAGENPFIIHNPQLLNQTTAIRAFGGLSTAIGPRINFNVMVSSSNVKNMPLFVADTSATFNNRFQVVYDDGTELTIKGELGVKVAEKITVTGLVKFNDYNMVNNGYAWHKPLLETGLDARYNIEDKIITYITLQYLTGIKIQEFELGAEKAETLKEIFDINVGAEYRYSKLLSGFFRLNNLAASKYYKWQYYPAQSFNFMVGITYAL